MLILGYKGLSGMGAKVDMYTSVHSKADGH